MQTLFQIGHLSTCNIDFTSKRGENKLTNFKFIFTNPVENNQDFSREHRLSSPKITALATWMDSAKNLTSKIFNQLTKGEKLNYNFEILNT